MKGKRQPGLTVAVMAWNEEASIAETMEDLLHHGDALQVPWELLLIDDGSTDATLDRASSVAANHPAFRCHVHEENGGLGDVYRSAFREARHELLTFFPADGQFSGELLHPYVHAMEGVDVVLGRMTNRQAPWLSRFYSSMERQIWDMLFGSFPHFDGIVMLRSRLLDEFPLVSTGRSWVVQRELLLRAHRAGKAMTWLDIENRPRRHGCSKVEGLSTAWGNLQEALELKKALEKEKA